MLVRQCYAGVCIEFAAVKKGNLLGFLEAYIGLKPEGRGVFRFRLRVIEEILKDDIQDADRSLKLVIRPWRLTEGGGRIFARVSI